VPPRDEQDYEQRRQQIIEGALGVFAQKGFEKATNKDIAEAAGIGSPGLIYHYFKDKADLLRQVYEERMPLLQLVAHPEHFLDMPPREGLTLFARTFLKVVDNPSAGTMLKLILGEAARRPEVADLFNQIGPGRGIPLMSRYLEQQMDAGRLRRMHPGAAARCFLGPLISYIAARELFVQPDSATISPELMAETMVDIFLKGMQVPEE
jgi:AcrR family transcriptional regulator